MSGTPSFSTLKLFLVLGALAWAVLPVQAQYRPHYRAPVSNPYNYYPPNYPGYNYFFGNPLTGVANIIDAQSNFMQGEEQARIMREQVNQSKLDTRKKTIEEMWYERENLPTYSDDREKDERLRLRASLHNPPTNEILSARALNELLPYTQKLASQGTMGPPISLDPDTLNNINFTVGSQGNPGLLKDGGKMSFPIALRGPTQQRLQKNIQEAVQLAKSDELTIDLLSQINKDVDTLDESLSNGIRTSKIDTTMYLNGKRFLDDLKSSLRVLQQADVARVLSNSYAAKGNTVQELVQNMSRSGQKFAPALPGEEGSYIALHSAMVAFALAASPNDSAFRIRLGQPPIAGASSAKN